MNSEEAALLRQLIVGVIASSLQGIPSVDWVIKRARHNDKARHAVAEFLHDDSALRAGVYLSSDQSGVLLIHDTRVRVPMLASFILKLKLTFKAVGIWRAPVVLRRTKLIRAQHPADKKFLYVPYFGVLPGERGRGAARELKNLLFKKSNDLGLPVYLETTQEQNRRVYERYGFTVFHEVRMKGSRFTTWMMKRG